jgi:hypothetical protein
MARDSISRGSVIAQTPVLDPYCGNYRCQHSDCCDRQSYFSNGLVSSLLQPLPCFVASDGAPASRDVWCESLDEAESLKQLPKLDVVVGKGAEQENQLEPEHPHRSSSCLVQFERLDRLETVEKIDPSSEASAALRVSSSRRSIVCLGVRLAPFLTR